MNIKIICKIAEAVPKPVAGRDDDRVVVVVLCTLGPVIIIAFIIAFIYWLYRKRKLLNFNEVSICLFAIHIYVLSFHMLYSPKQFISSNFIFTKCIAKCDFFLFFSCTH